jgi:phosphoglycerate dehydrogenase-like enzyme
VLRRHPSAPRSLSPALPRRLLQGGKWERSKFMGSELSGKTIGVVGLGRIGREVARWCQSFGMVTVGYDPVMAPDVAARAGITPVTLDELYARSDYITLHTPRTPETTNLICTASLAKCKAGVRIVNVARGGIVSEGDLLEALNSGRVAAAALDVYSQEPPPEAVKGLLTHPNVICTPHLGASTSEAQLNVARDIAAQMADALDNKAFVGACGLPLPAAVVAAGPGAGWDACDPVVPSPFPPPCHLPCVIPAPLLPAPQAS